VWTAYGSAIIHTRGRDRSSLKTFFLSVKACLERELRHARVEGEERKGKAHPKAQLSALVWPCSMSRRRFGRVALRVVVGLSSTTAPVTA
jgi:hypothetical protein